MLQLGPNEVMRVIETVGYFILTPVSNKFRSTATLLSPALTARFYPVGANAPPSAKLSEKTTRPLLFGYPDPEFGTKKERKDKKEKQSRRKTKRKKKGTLGSLVKKAHIF